MSRNSMKATAAALVAVAGFAGATLVANGQTATLGTPPPPPLAVQAATPTMESYSYRPEGRRDPFVSLVNRGSDRKDGQRPLEGLRGMFASDLVLKGILVSRNSYLAIVQGPDARRPYIAHTNDRLADGVIKAITADSLLILQEVNDPLSLTKQREIRKTLRVVEEVK